MKIFITLCMSLLLISAVPTTALAQSDEATARATERKNRLKTKLDNASIARIVSKCEASQKKLKDLKATIADAQSEKLSKYQAFIEKARLFEQNLASKGIKSTDLLAQIAEAQKLYDVAAMANTKLATSVNDASVINRKTDPNGFKASLDEARTEIKNYFNAQKTLNQYLKQTLKATITTLKANN